MTENKHKDNVPTLSSNAQSYSSQLTRLQVWALLTSSLLPLIDSTLVNVLLPQVATEFHASESAAQWGISGFMATATIGIAGSSTIIHRYQPVTVWRLTVIGFALISVVVGASPTLWCFIIARMVQGLSCGLIMPSVQAIAVDIVGRANMRVALAKIGLPAVIAPAFGPLLGGALVEVMGWRILFFINFPIAILSILLGHFCLVGTQTADSDAAIHTPVSRSSIGLLPQIGAVSIGVIALIGLTTMSSNQIYWTDSNWIKPTIAAIVAVSGLALFVLLDVRATHPLLGMHMYRRGSFATVMLLCLTVGLVFYGTLLTTSLLIQGTFHEPAWAAGIVLAVQGLGAWLSRNLVKGKLAKVNAVLLMGCGLILTAMGAIIMEIGNTWQSTPMLAGALIRGVGLGCATLVALSAAYEVISTDEKYTAGAHTRVTIQLGGAIGSCLAGVWATMTFVGDDNTHPWKQLTAGHLSGTIFTLIALLAGITAIVWSTCRSRMCK